MPTTTVETIGAPGRNIARQSEKFSASYWTPNFASGSIDDDAAVAPDGTTTADRVNDDDASDVFAIYHDFSGLNDGDVVCWSIFFKADTAPQIVIELQHVSGTVMTLARINTATGAWTVETGGGGLHLAHVGPAPKDFPEPGWFRAQVVSTYDIADGGGSLDMRAELRPDTAVTTTTLSTFFWGAQVEIRTAEKPYATPYQPQNEVGDVDAYVGDYETIQAWITAHNGENLVSGDLIYEGRLLDELYVVEAGDLVIGTATTDATRYRHLTADPSLGNYDPWTNRGPRIVSTAWTENFTNIDEEVVLITEDNFHLEGVGIFCEDELEREPGLGTPVLSGIRVEGSGVRVRNVLVEIREGGLVQNTVSPSLICFWVDGTSGANLAEDVQFHNCIARGGESGTGANFGFFFDAFILHGGVYNCIAHQITHSNTPRGFYSTGVATHADGPEILNCIAIEWNSDNPSLESFCWEGLWRRYGHIVTSDRSAEISGGGTSVNSEEETNLPDPNSKAFVSARACWNRADAFDYRLKRNSPAHDAGRDEEDIAIAAWGDADDWNGVDRTGEVQWSVGPHEEIAGPVAVMNPTIVDELIGLLPTCHYPTPLEAVEHTDIKHLLNDNEVRSLQIAQPTEIDITTEPLIFRRTFGDQTHYRELTSAPGNRFEPIAGTGAMLAGEAKSAFKFPNKSVVDLREPYARCRAIKIRQYNSSNSHCRCLRIAAPYCRADSVFLEFKTGNGTTHYCLSIRKCSHILVTNCVGVGAGDNLAGANSAFHVQDAQRVRILNSIAFEIAGQTTGAQRFGFRQGLRTELIHFENCIGMDSGTGDFEHDVGVPAYTQRFNISSDTTAAGAGAQTGKTAAETFHDAAADDFRVPAGSPAARKGFNLKLFFSADFDGAQRFTPWNIGIYEGLFTPPLTGKSVVLRGGYLSTCWEIIRQDGVAFCFTDCNIPLPHGGQTFQPAGGFNATARRGETGLRERNVSAVGAITSDLITVEDIVRGRFAGARVIERLVDWRFPFAAPVDYREYTLGGVHADGEVWRADMVGLAEELAQAQGRYVTVGCPLELGGDECGVDFSADVQDDVRVSSTIQDARLMFDAESADIPVYADDFFGRGLLYWLTGDNAGQPPSQVKNYTNANRTIELEEETEYLIQAADTFYLEPGCRKRYVADCYTKFGNGPRFGGDPFMPGTDKALQTPTR